jgi:hypothetical protein
MRSLYAACRSWISVLGITLAMLAAPSPAQEALDTATPAPWQEVISGQIQAFRDRDAPTAFSYAGTAFQISFQNAEIFFETIVRSGYAPIMDSHSHSFGDYLMISSRAVLQRVRLVGIDLQLYEAIYQLIEEPDGWRVQGVQLFRQRGMAS